MRVFMDDEVFDNETYQLEESGVYFISILEDGQLVGTERLVKH
jgi:hypothetical protein